MPLITIYIKGKKVLVYVATINDTLGVPNPSNDAFETKIQESDLKWASWVLALKGKASKLRVPIFSSRPKCGYSWCLNGFFLRGNIVNVEFHQDMVVSLALVKFEMNVGA